MGLLKKKSLKNSTKEAISAKFLSLDSDREIVSHKIIHNSFVPLSRSNITASLIDDLSSDVALQDFKKMLAEGNSRIHVEFKLDEGKPLIKFIKKYISDGQTIQINLSAQNLVEALKTIGEQVINTIEKNTYTRISFISLIFLQDNDRKIWLMGTSDCIVYDRKATNRSITPVKSQETFKTSTPDLSLSKSNTFMKNNRLITSKRCPGDFCDYSLIKDDKILEKTDADYEEFISKITLAFYSDTNGQSNKYKQELGSNCIEKEHEKLRTQQVTNSISFRYILIGRSILSIKEKNSNIEITPKEIKKAYEPEFKQTDKPPNPLAHPTRMYDETKVCDKCYEVYNLIRALKSNHKPVRNLPRISREIPQYFNIDRNSLKDAVDDQDYKYLNKDSKSQYSMLYKLAMTEKSNTEHVTEKLFDDIASKIFPKNYVGSWGIKSQQQKNSESWKKYISSLKQKSVMRNRLKVPSNH